MKKTKLITICLPLALLTLSTACAFAEEEHTAALMAEVSAEKMVLESQKRQALMDCNSLHLDNLEACKEKAESEYQEKMNLLEQDPTAYFVRKRNR